MPTQPPKTAAEWLNAAFAEGFNATTGDRSAAAWLAVKLAEMEAENERLRQQINPMPSEPSYPCCGDCKACEHRSRCVTDGRKAAGCSIV